MSKRTTFTRIERPRSMWVGQPVEPQNERGKPPNGGQKHYGAVELPGAGENIYVNDVVQVLPKHNSGGSEKERFRLTQVLSIWEDTFTSVIKFRARLLIRASDLPQDVLSRLCAARRTFSNGIRSSTDDHLGSDDEVEYNEVFLTPKLEDLEIRLIVKSVTLSVTPSPKTAILVGLKRKMGPRLTHTYDDSTGDFAPVDDTDPILKHARIRQAEAVDIASRENQEHDPTKKEEPVKSTGWLRPKRSVFYRKDRDEIASHCRRGLEVNNWSCSSPVSAVHVGSPVSAIGMEISKASELEGVSNSKNEQSNERVDCNGEATSTDNGPYGISKQIATFKEGELPNKSARQRRFQRCSDSNAEVNSGSFVDFCSTPMLSSSSQRHSRASATTGARFLPPRSRGLGIPPILEGGQQVAIPGSGGDACIAIDNQLSAQQARLSSIRDASEAQVENSRTLPRSFSPGSPTSAVSWSKVSCKMRRNCTKTTTNNTSIHADGGFADKVSQEEAGYPRRLAPVGREFQTDIPDLLPYEERKREHTGTSARMVWRSIRDWDPQSRGMLAEYLHAAKVVVQAKQARPGVAIHVRLGDISIGVDQEDGYIIDSIDRVGSYAVWAVTAGRGTTYDVVRVACSEMAQTEVPRSAIQRVQCKEEALAALMNTRCALDDYGPALDLLARTSSGPQSVEQWTLNQVRTLERALHDEFDPKQRLHGWARPVMAMDREDFIDLANVSKRVPGKTPAQVLGFYYRYLAAAEPLTDVVYGPKAAEARRQEEIPQDCEVNRQNYLGSGSARGSSRTTNIRVGSRQTSDRLQRASSGNLRKGVGSGSGSGLPKSRLSSSESQVLRLQFPKASQEHIPKASKTDVDQSTATDTSVGFVGYEEAEPPLRQATIGIYGSTAGKFSSGLTAPNLPLPRSKRSSRAVEGTTYAGCGPSEEPFDRTSYDDDGGQCALNKTTSGAHAAIKDDVNRNSDGGRTRHTDIQHGRRAGHNSTDSSPDRPPVAESFEVQDSDEETSSKIYGGDRRRVPLSIPNAKALLPKLVVKAAATYPNTLGPQGLKRVPRQMRSSSAGPVSASTVQPPTTDSVRPRSGGPKGSSMERPRTGRATNTPDAVPPRDARLTDVQRNAIWEGQSAPRSNHHGPHIWRHDGRYMYGVGRSSTPELGTAPPDNNVQQTLETAQTDDMFGVMAPCWRLLERAKWYMDKDQLVYMRGLILLHAKKPMRRDQLLERAEGCLQEQGHIFAAFVKMLDGINHPPSVPFYPTKKQPGPSPSSG